MNGRNYTYIVSFRKKQRDFWKLIRTTSKSHTVRQLTSGETYEVKVGIQYDRNSISTDVKEIFVGRKGACLNVYL